MKNPNRATVSKLEALPNIGKSISADLNLIGINHPQQLIDQDPIKMYQALSAAKNQKVDPCVLDVFMAAVDFMNGGETKPWWRFTQKRKELLAKQQVTEQ